MNASDSLTPDTFADAHQRKGITVIDFGPDWCGPCRTMAPQLLDALERIAAEAPADPASVVAERK
jgi:thiol-disulfide isomerase/thioredoxin